VLLSSESHCETVAFWDIRAGGSERSSAWLEHLLWEQDVAGSNPVAPTTPQNPLPRELQVLRLVAQGKTLKEIAADLSLNENIIDT
jgi:DNA-binding NarL/FixJ family response regulator